MNNKTKLLLILMLSCSGHINAMDKTPMNDKQCKQALELYFKEKGSAKELALLQGSKNRTALIKHAIDLRHPKDKDGKINNYAPEIAIRDYFCALPGASEQDIALHNFLVKAAVKYSNYLRKRSLAIFTTEKFKALINDAQYAISQFLIPLHPDDQTKIYPPLERAIDADNEEIVTGCLRAGCALDTHDNDKRTPFERALIRGKLCSVKAFIEYGVPELAQKFDHFMQLAATSGNKALVSYLAKHEESMLKKQSQELANQSIQGYLTCNLLRLLRSGANPDTREAFYDRIPLDWSLSTKAVIYSQTLLNYGANPNATYDFQYKDGSIGKNPLAIIALQKQDVPSLRLLLESKTDPNATYDGQCEDGSIGKYPLAFAALEKQDSGALRLLLESKADANATYDFQYKDGSIGKNPLAIIALQKQDVPSLRLLLESKADPNATYDAQFKDDSIGKYPLAFASLEKQDTASLRLLLEHKAVANATYDFQYKDGSIGKYPLAFAALLKQDATSLRLLLESKADPNATYDAQIKDGPISKYPLAFAALAKQDTASLRLLLEHKADPNATSDSQFKDGSIGKYSLADIALQKQDAASLRLLLESKADPNAIYHGIFKDGSLHKLPIIFYSAYHGDAPSTRLLLAYKANPHVKDETGNSIVQRLIIDGRFNLTIAALLCN